MAAAAIASGKDGSRSRSGLVVDEKPVFWNIGDDAGAGDDGADCGCLMFSPTRTDVGKCCKDWAKKGFVTPRRTGGGRSFFCVSFLTSAS